MKQKQHRGFVVWEGFMIPIDCDCPEGLEGDCEACRQEVLEQGIERAMLEAEEYA